MNKKIIIYITLVFSILVVSYLSQQPYMQNVVKNISPYLSKYGGASLLGALKTNSPVSNNNAKTNGDDPKTSSNNTTNANSVDSYKLTESAYNSTNTNAPQSIGSYVSNKANIAVTGISDLSQKVTEGLKSGGEAVTNSINSTKENISTAEKKVVNYFSGISDAIQGKEIIPVDNQCPPIK